MLQWFGITLDRFLRSGFESCCTMLGKYGEATAARFGQDMSLQCLGFGTQWPFVSSLPIGSWRPQEQNCFCGVGNGWNMVEWCMSWCVYSHNGLSSSRMSATCFAMASRHFVMMTGCQTLARRSFLPESHVVLQCATSISGDWQTQRSSEDHQTSWISSSHLITWPVKRHDHQYQLPKTWFICF